MKLSTSFLHIMLCMFVLAYPADNIYHRWADGVLTPSIGGFYRPRSEGYVSQVCVTHSVQLGGMTPDASWDKSHGHGGRWSCPGGGGGGGGQPPPPARVKGQPPPPGYIWVLRSMGGWYASYWNAFLLRVPLLLQNSCEWTTATIQPCFVNSHRSLTKQYQFH